MCGINGIIGREDRKLVQEMNKRISHRGPDATGIYSDSQATLGHCRLSIIDLTERGKQPMCNEEGTVWITFNGEIYNYQEIRKELTKHKFTSNTDTEVIIHAYEEYGSKCLDKLDGMFAFAIWDSEKKTLFLARDRYGKKPLYYTIIKEELYFSSELKAVLLSGIKKKVSKEALSSFLSLRYVPESMTILEGIQKLQPGHYAIFKNGKITIKKYWEHTFQKNNLDEATAIKKARELLEKAVQKRLMSEVPLGVFLSGGIDSSSIAALMKPHADVKTFSMGFDIDGFQDELPKARAVAEYLGTDHHEFSLKIDPFEIFPKAVWHADEPLADPAMLPTYVLAQEAKKHLTVALLGEGADEHLAGYEQYKIMCMANRILPLLPKFSRRTVAKITSKMPPSIFNPVFKYAGSLGLEGIKRLSSFVENYGKTAEDYFTILSIMTNKEKAELYHQSLTVFQTQSLFKPIFSKYRHEMFLNQMLAVDIQTFLVHLLMKVDKMTMAHSVEARVPFLDKDFTEFVGGLPTTMKLNWSTEKYILRKCMKGILPESVTKTKKQRFFVPIDKYLAKTLKTIATDYCSKENLKKQGFFDYYTVKKIIENYPNSPLYYGRQLWNITTFQIWHKTFIEEDGGQPIKF